MHIVLHLRHVVEKDGIVQSFAPKSANPTKAVFGLVYRATGQDKKWNKSTLYGLIAETPQMQVHIFLQLKRVVENDDIIKPSALGPVETTTAVFNQIFAQHGRSGLML